MKNIENIRALHLCHLAQIGSEQRPQFKTAAAEMPDIIGSLLAIALYLREGILRTGDYIGLNFSTLYYNK